MNIKHNNLLDIKAIPDNTILVGLMGSHSHGTYIPKTDPNSIDDIDLMGVSIAPTECYIGLGNFEQLIYKQDEWDVITYEIKKYFRLLLKSNPNVIGLLWLREEDYIYRDYSVTELIEKRDIFSSKLIYDSFTGYAYSQLKRMTHYKFEGYMGAKRKELVDTFGFDCKNAAHLIRLLRMGIEFLKTSELNVFRKDANELIEIKTGKWSLDKIKKEADILFNDAKLALADTKLPDLPNYKEAERILINIIKQRLKLS